MARIHDQPLNPHMYALVNMEVNVCLMLILTSYWTFQEIAIMIYDLFLLIENETYL